MANFLSTISAAIDDELSRQFGPKGKDVFLDAGLDVQGIAEVVLKRIGIPSVRPGSDLHEGVSMAIEAETERQCQRGRFDSAKDVREGLDYCEIACRALDLIDWRARDPRWGILSQVEAEMKRAEVWPAFNSAHEGYAILLEEVDELKLHVWTNQKRRDLTAMRDEAIQVAAMALKFVQMVDAGRGRV